MEILATIVTICIVLWTVFMLIVAAWSWSQYKVYKMMTDDMINKNDSYMINSIVKTRYYFFRYNNIPYNENYNLGGNYE